MNKKPLRNYQKACNQLAAHFIGDYFDDCTLTYNDFDWVGDDIGGVLHVNDFYFSMSDIYEAMKLKPEKDKFFDYYYYCLDCSIKGESPNYNLKSFIQNS